MYRGDITTKITRLLPRDFNLRKRPIGNSGAFFWYARHGREFMGCKSPVRDWESQGDQYTK